MVTTGGRINITDHIRQIITLILKSADIQTFWNAAYQGEERLTTADQIQNSVTSPSNNPWFMIEDSAF